MNTNIQEDFEICISLPLGITESAGGSKTAATSKIERFAVIVHGFQPLTWLPAITKRSILDVAAVLDPPLESLIKKI